MVREGDEPEIRSGLVVMDDAGAAKGFGLGPLTGEWPSVADWLDALPIPLDSVFEGGPQTVDVSAADGRTHRFRLTATPGDDGEGRAIRVERPSRMPADRLRAVLDILDDLAWSIDAEYRLTAYNRSFIQAFMATAGRGPRLGENVLDSAANGLLAAVWQDFYDRALLGERVQVELDETLLTVPGTTLMALSACPIYTHGRVSGAVCFLRDLSELRTQSRAVQRQNAMLDALGRVQSRFIGQAQTVGIYDELLDVLLELTDSPFGFLGEARWSEEGEPSWVVTAISDVAPDETSRRRRLQAAAGGMAFDSTDSLVGQVLATGRPVLTNDPRAAGVPRGHAEIGSFLGLPCRLGDRLLGVVGVANRPGGYDASFIGFLQPLLRTFANIIEARRSEQRRQSAEVALQQAKETAEKADRAKGEFLASMSHEIRTPLNAVMGLCELALDVAVDADQTSLLRAARTNSETLLNLISDILDFSRIDAGKVELDLAPFDLRRLVEDVAEAMAIRADPKGVAVSAAVEPVLPSPLIGDAHRVRQVLTNLVSNAVKYTAEGEVRIEVCAAREQDRVRVRIDVVDTGLGIAPEEHGRIFDRFHRVVATANVGGGGTGLGLSITKVLVEHMHGIIELESAVGQGSRFRVELPLGIAPETVDDGPPASLLADVRVALVHPATGDGPLIKRLLTAFGARVERMDTAEEGALGGFDVVLGPEPMPECSAPVVELASVAALGRPSRGERRLTQPVRRDALLDAVITAAGLEHELAHAPSLSALPDVTHCAVLLVEDHPDNRAVARRHLERRGHVVELAEHGGIAVERARESAFDIVLMDLHMPEVDGFAAVRRIRADEQRLGARPVPIVAVTAHATADIRRRCFEVGFDGFVPKPVTGKALLEAVERFANSDPVALIVDDAADSRRLLVRHLRRALAVRLRVAQDGASARAVIEANPPQLALIDATLPDESGFALAAWLRERAGPGATIIMVTGRTDPRARQMAQEAGCDGFVTKPVDRRVLISTIESHFGQSRAWAASQPGAPLIAPLDEVLPGAPLRAPEVADPRLQVGAEATEGSLDGLRSPSSVDTLEQVPMVVEVAYVEPDLLDLIPPFLQDRRHDLAAIAVAVDADDMDTIARLGHSMKGSGRAYGMPHISSLGRRIEQAAREGHLEGVRAACDDLAIYVDAVRVLPEP